jgi:hypothetical protein
MQRILVLKSFAGTSDFSLKSDETHLRKVELCMKMFLRAPRFRAHNLTMVQLYRHGFLVKACERS